MLLVLMHKLMARKQGWCLSARRSRRAEALQGAACGAARARDLGGRSAAVGPEVDPGLVEGVAHIGGDGAVQTVLFNAHFVCRRKEIKEKSAFDRFRITRQLGKGLWERQT
jgi:hypothetical protein